MVKFRVRDIVLFRLRVRFRVRVSFWVGVMVRFRVTFGLNIIQTVTLT